MASVSTPAHTTVQGLGFSVKGLGLPLCTITEPKFKAENELRRLCSMLSGLT